MKNGEWMVKNGYKFRELTYKWCNKTGKYDYDILLNNKCVGKVKDSYSSEAITTWLDMEHEEPILTNSEREYLSAVIKPFKDRVKSITKVYWDYTGGEKHCYILIKCDEVCDSFGLPEFNELEMYRGMEYDHDYTLKELGL